MLENKGLDIFWVCLKPRIKIEKGMTGNAFKLM